MTEAEILDQYRRHGYFLFRRCLAFLADEGAAQDAVQEVFVRALRAGARFRGEADPRTWLCRISDNHCRDLLRQAKRRERPAPHDDRGAGDQTAAEPAALVRHDDPEAILTARRVMASLDPSQQRLAVLYYIDELTQEEAAAEMGLSRRTIGKRLRALATRARTFLGEKEPA
jgi:RNA polymerase sigma-70 factor (ECF subfamily)